MRRAPARAGLAPEPAQPAVVRRRLRHRLDGWPRRRPCQPGLRRRDRAPGRAPPGRTPGPPARGRRPLARHPRANARRRDPPRRRRARCRRDPVASPGAGADARRLARDDYRRLPDLSRPCLPPVGPDSGGLAGNCCILPSRDGAGLSRAAGSSPASGSQVVSRLSSLRSSFH
ncbi:hypothetical protein CNECB9_720003 [Cupriavidus necator]|uniref:Uncharacterized protein n=1 Tax=Cupriavidus necator TaxID=106590 RepID=A0A1K0IS06_CUPNE|nr:hypothetical protein CNECB9_720003 [Cupriavidus necator]